MPNQHTEKVNLLNQKKIMETTINTEQRLYVTKQSNGYSTLGFDVCINRRNSLATELQKPEFTTATVGTIEAYNEYMQLIKIAAIKAKTGWRSNSELIPELIGLEGKRVEVEYSRGKERFYVGKSTGFIPCHLAIKTKRSTGGIPVIRGFTNLRVIY